MKRKINRVGVNTLTISLPSDWTSKHHLKQGDELQVYPEQDKIVFSTIEQKHHDKEITLNIDHFNKYLLSRYLDVLYINNFNKIMLVYTISEIYDDKQKKNIPLKTLIKQLSNRFIGVEIISQTTAKTELSCFLLKEKQELAVIEKRIYFLLKELMQELLGSIDGDYKKFHVVIYDHHDSILKFINYYLRTLNTSEKTEEEKKTLFCLYRIIDKLVDKLRHLSEMIHRYGCSNKVKKHLQEIFELLSEQFLMLHKEKVSTELITKRYNLVKKIDGSDYTLEELRVITEVKIFLDTINDFYFVLISASL